MKIGLFADSHYCSKELLGTNRRPVLSYNKIKDSVGEFMLNGVDLIVCLGDLIDDDGEMSRNILNLERVGKLINESGVESICCMGNHDAVLFTNDEFERISGIKTAPATLARDDIRLIFLDANYAKDGVRYNSQNNDWTDSNITENGINALAHTLSTCFESKIVVFSHQNIDPSVEPRHMIKNAAKVRKILSDDGRITAVYQGHYHPGAENNIDNIEYITLKAMCTGTENFYKIIEI